MDDSLELFTEKDKEHAAYGLCVLGWVATGATLGSLAGGQTFLGVAGGAAWGLFTCRYLTEPLKRRLFSYSERLSEDEFRQVFTAAKRQFPFAAKGELLDAIAQSRVEFTRSPTRFRC